MSHTIEVWGTPWEVVTTSVFGRSETGASVTSSSVTSGGGGGRRLSATTKSTGK
ncbi:phosphoglycerate kinase [Biomphalaria glabrata]|nr:phosphoglycerate kinase [Biomphalaria glabrata]